MEIVIRVDTANPGSPERLKAEAQWLLDLADNLPDFIARAPGNVGVDATKVFGGSDVTPPAPPAADHKPSAPPPPPPVDTPPPVVGGAAVNLLPPSPPAATGAEVDASGLPWDERIHSGTKARNADGKWKKRKNVSPQLVAEVETALRGGASAPAPAAAPTAPPPPPPVADTATSVATQAPPPPPAAASNPGIQSLQLLTQAVAAGRLTVAEVQEQCALYGVANVGELSGNPLAMAGIIQAFQLAGKL